MSFLRKILIFIFFYLLCSHYFVNLVSANNFIRMVAGPSGGSWYPLGSAITNLMEKNIDNVLTSTTSGGGISNIISVNEGDADIGWTYSNTVYDAWVGRDKFRKKHQNIRYFASLYPAVLQIAINKNSGIKNFEDLAFANISPGKPKWTGTAFIERVMESHGFNFNSIKKNNFNVHMVSYRKSVELMKNGRADVFLAVTSVPQASFIELENFGINFLSLSKNNINKILKNNPGIISGYIPSNAYKSLKKNLPSIGITTSLIVNKNLSDDLVYKMTKVLWENKIKLERVKAVWKKVSIINSLNGAGIPIHNGARKFYVERGILESNEKYLDGKILSADAKREKIKRDKQKNIEKKFSENRNISEKEQILMEKEKKIISLQKKNEEEARKRKILEQRMAELERKNKELQQPKKKQKAKPKSSSGSGFFISRLGHIITNQHVVNKCSRITVGDRIDKQVPAELLDSDKRNDLALLKTTSLKLASTETKSLIQKLRIEIVPLATGGLMRGNDVKLGEDVLVAGFPYGDIFSKNIKVTKGIVSSTTGIKDDSGQFQLDAAVQPGNSGGPIYDKYGNIVGVVVAQLNKFKMAKAIGSLPENVNFGIKASTVKQFINESIPTRWSERTKEISTTKLSEIAKMQTVMVICHG